MAIEDDAERQAARKLGQQMRRLRERKGWTAKALGRKAGDYDRSTISCIETGQGKCSLKLIQGCDDALGAGGELVKVYFELKEAHARRKEAIRERAVNLDFPFSGAPQGPTFLEISEHDTDTIEVWLPIVVNGRLAVMPLSLPRRKILAAGVAGLLTPLTCLNTGERERVGRVIAGDSRADMQVVEHLEMLLAQYRKLDDLMGPRHIHGPVRSLCDLADHLCETAEPPVQQALLSVAAQCRQFDGFLWMNSGDQAAGERSYEAAIARSVAAGNQAFAGYVLAWRSGQAVLQEQGPAAIALAQEAQTPKWQLTPAIRAWAAGLEAWAWALQREPDRCKHKLDESRDLLTQSISSGGDEPPWIYWFGEEYLAVYRGVCLTDAGDAEPAIETLNQAIAALPRDRVRDRADCLSWLAKAHACNGDPEQAGATAQDATQAAIETGSAQRLQRLRQLYAALQRWKDVEAVRDLGELLRSAGAAPAAGII